MMLHYLSQPPILGPGLRSVLRNWNAIAMSLQRHQKEKDLYKRTTYAICLIVKSFKLTLIPMVGPVVGPVVDAIRIDPGVSAHDRSV